MADSEACGTICHTCVTVLEKYGTTESVVSWLCSCRDKSGLKIVSSKSVQDTFWCKWGCCDGRRCEHKPRKARKFRTSW